jgi:hypothetical protein
VHEFSHDSIRHWPSRPVATYAIQVSHKNFRWEAASLFALLVLSSAQTGLCAESFPAQGRLFVGNTFISPAELNSEMSAQGLTPFKGMPELGLEITYPLWRLLDVGMRYSRRGATEYLAGSTAATTFRGDLRQDSILLLARVPVVRTQVLKFDLFAGFGGNNTTFEIASAGENGQLTRKASSELWVASPEASAGASVGVGYRKFFLYVEGGYDLNRAHHLARTGTVGGSVGTIDLSGPYVLLGVLFDGISGTKQ